jgi:hypothetical protein
VSHVKASDVVPGQLLWVYPGMGHRMEIDIWAHPPWGQRKTSEIGSAIGSVWPGDACLVVAHDVDRTSPYLLIVTRGTFGWVRHEWLFVEATP